MKKILYKRTFIRYNAKYKLKEYITKLIQVGIIIFDNLTTFLLNHTFKLSFAILDQVVLNTGHKLPNLNTQKVASTHIKLTKLAKNPAPNIKRIGTHSST